MEILNQIIAYSKDVINGDIIACVKHKQACQRFLRDLERQGDTDFPWAWDEEQVKRFFGFCERMKHRKGELAGQPKKLVPYEQFVYGNLYGWWDAEGNGVRRFRQSYIQMGRKNGKSQMQGISALYEISSMGEPAAEAYVAATKRSQTQYVFDEAVWLIENCGLSRYFSYKHSDRFQTKVITHLKTGGVFSRLSKDDKKFGDGSCPSYVCIDEYHAHPTSEYVDLMTSGFGSRKNPLLNIITTAGFELSNPCFRVEYDLASRILNGTAVDDRYFCIVAELDHNTTTETMTVGGREIPAGSLIDELGTVSAIMKSNPVTGYLPTVQRDLIEKTNQAMQSKEKMRNLLTKHYNVWLQSSDAGYMDMARWNTCTVTTGELYSIIQEQAEGRVYIGFDLSHKIDLTAVAFIATWTGEDSNQYYAVKTHAFIPSDKFHERMETDKMPYGVWRDAGHLTITSGAVVDYQYVVKYVLDTVAQNKWQDVMYCLDPWGAASVSNDLMNEGKEVVEVIQGIKTLSAPTKAF